MINLELFLEMKSVQCNQQCELVIKHFGFSMKEVIRSIHFKKKHGYSISQLVKVGFQLQESKSLEMANQIDNSNYYLYHCVISIASRVV